MRNVFRNSPEKITGAAAAVTSPVGTEDVDEDTIELMLTPEQMRGLARAAAEDVATAASPPSPTSPPQASVTPSSSDQGAKRRATEKSPPRPWPAGGVAAIVGVTVVLGTLVALGAIAQRTSERKHLAAAVPVPTPAVAAPEVTSPPPAPGEPVRFKNPFDRSEVFEFPPGTSPAEARQAVAQVLMERARDRHVQFAQRKHGAVRKTTVRGGANLVQNSLR